MVEVIYCDRCGKPVEKETKTPGFEYFNIKFRSFGDFPHLCNGCYKEFQVLLQSFLAEKGKTSKPITSFSKNNIEKKEQSEVKEEKQTQKKRFGVF